MAVKKWELKGNAPTNMNANTEHELRLFIVEKMHNKARAPKSKFYDIYMATKKFFNSTVESTSVVHANF